MATQWICSRSCPWYGPIFLCWSRNAATCVFRTVLGYSLETLLRWLETKPLLWCLIHLPWRIIPLWRTITPVQLFIPCQSMWKCMVLYLRTILDDPALIHPAPMFTDADVTAMKNKFTNGSRRGSSWFLEDESELNICPSRIASRRLTELPAWLLPYCRTTCCDYKTLDLLLFPSLVLCFDSRVMSTLMTAQWAIGRGEVRNSKFLSWIQLGSFYNMVTWQRLVSKEELRTTPVGFVQVEPRNSVFIFLLDCMWSMENGLARDP
jgi:hypothetical protein